MAEDTENQVIIMVKNLPFYTTQLDESTNISSKTLLLCLVRVEYERELSGKTTLFPQLAG